MRLFAGMCVIAGFFAAQVLAAPAAIASHGGTPNVTASPNSGLNRAGQTITISGTGWAPNHQIVIQPCRSAPSHSYCLSSHPNVAADAAGNFVTTMSISYTLNGIITSCEDPYCEIEATDIAGGTFDKAPISFTGSSSTNATPIPTNAGSIPFGSSVADRAVVTGNATFGTPTGAVSFYICGPSPISDRFCEGGTAVSGNPQTLTPGTGNSANATSGQFTPGSPGMYCFLAVYSGDASYGQSYDDNATQCFFARLDSTTTTSPSRSWAALGQSVSDDAVVAGSAPGGSPDGYVYFYVCGPIDEPATCASGGSLLAAQQLTASTNDTASTISPAFTPTRPGRYCFRAEFIGSDKYFKSSDGSSSECFLIGGFPRPKGASPARFSFVPAYEECTSANKQHGGPLASPSCGPPVQASDYLTVGSPDANGKAAGFTGSLDVVVIPGNSSTTTDEADVQLKTSLTDVRRSDLADYGGELQVRVGVRATDRSNGPALDETGTVEDFALAYAVPCTPTAEATVGSTCALATSLDAVLGDPNAAKEGSRAVWQLGKLDVFDGGADGIASSTGDNTLFATQGVFTP